MAPHLAGGGVVGQRHVVLVEETEQGTVPRPRPGAAAVEPEQPVVPGGARQESLDSRVVTGVVEAHDSSRKFATRAAPCSLSTDSGWNCTPHNGFVRCATPITTGPSGPSHQAFSTSTAGTSSAASEW